MNLHFYSSTKDKFCDVAFSIIPYGKAVLVSDEKNFINRDKQLSIELNLKGLRVSNVVLSENEKFCLSSACGLFNFAEDFRLIITATRKLFDFCLYFSEIRQIPALILCEEEEIVDALSVKVGCFSDLGIRGVYVDAPRHVFIQNNKTNQSLIYADALLKRFAIKEYKIIHMIDGEQSNDFFEDCDNILNNNVVKELRAVNFKTIILNYRSGGKLFDYSAPFMFKFLRSCSSFKAVLYAQYLCDDLSAVLSGRKLNLPDYNARAVEASNLFGVDESVIYNSVKEQITSFKQNKGRVEFVFSLLKDEIEKLQEFLEQGILDYYSLGGKKETLSEKDKKAGLLLGDLIEKINFASIVRESGCYNLENYDYSV